MVYLSFEAVSNLFVYFSFWSEYFSLFTEGARFCNSSKNTTVQAAFYIPKAKGLKRCVFNNAKNTITMLHGDSF